MPKNLAALAVCLAVATVTLVAQLRYLPNAPGAWKPWAFVAYPDNRRQLGAQPLEVKAFERELLALSAILKNTAGFASPLGFSVETVGELSFTPSRASAGPGQPALTRRPLPGSLNFGAYGVYETAAGVRGDTGETSQLLFFVNQPELPLFASADTDVPEFEHVEADVVRLAAPQADLFGMARYGDTLVIKKSPAPIWVPAPLADVLDLAARSLAFRLAKSRETVVQLQTRYDEIRDPAKKAKRIAEYKALAPMTKDPAAYMATMMKADASIESQADTLLGPLADAKKEVAAIEQQLASAKAASAALPLADRTAPACYASQERVSLSRFKRHPLPGCVPLVRPNWALFNPALPRSAPQILTISHFSGCVGDGPKPLHVGGCAANRRLLESIDQQALLAWLK